MVNSEIVGERVKERMGFSLENIGGDAIGIAVEKGARWVVVKINSSEKGSYY